MEYEDGKVPVLDLVECNTCNRSFLPIVLEKHAKICQKTVVKKRKVFDSSRQRADGTDIPTLKPLKPKAEPPKKPSNWRKKHENFIATIRAAKMHTQAIKEGGPLPPPPPPTYDPDYIQCPHCQRRFNESAAERHIKFCKEQAARMPNKNKLEVKKAPARTQDKPSAVSTVPSTTSRLPQRSGLGQSTTIPLNKASSARSNPSGLTSPPSGVGNKNRTTSSGYGPVRNKQSGVAFNKNKVTTPLSRNKDVGMNDERKNGMKAEFCHSCGTKYPIESAKFCCECGIKRMCF